MQQAARVLPKKETSNIITKRKQIPEVVPGHTYEVLLDLFRPNPEQPRKIFNEESLRNTAGSLQGNVEEPVRVVVRNAQSGFYFLIVDGERRWRAAKIAGLQSVSCLVLSSMSDNAVYLSSVKSNCDREPFNPVEEAGIVVELEKRFGWNQAKIAKELGKSPGYISNVIKYLKLCIALREKLINGEIDKAVALNLASFQSDKQENLHERFLEETGGKKLNPRDIPRIMKGVAKKIKAMPRSAKRGKKHASHPDLVVTNLERAMSGLAEAIKEFDALSDDEIIGQKSCHIIDLITMVTNCHERIGVLAERINVLD